MRASIQTASGLQPVPILLPQYPDFYSLSLGFPTQLPQLRSYIRLLFNAFIISVHFRCAMQQLYVLLPLPWTHIYIPWPITVMGYYPSFTLYLHPNPLVYWPYLWKDCKVSHFYQTYSFSATDFRYSNRLHFSHPSATMYLMPPYSLIFEAMGRLRARFITRIIWIKSAIYILW